MCCTRLAENTGRKSRQKSPSGHHRTTLSGYSSNTSSTCPQNMANFGPPTAEIGWPVWGVTARHSSSGGQPNFAALNRARHLYSAGRPSRLALAHISSCCCFTTTLLLVFVILRSVQHLSCDSVGVHFCAILWKTNSRHLTDCGPSVDTTSSRPLSRNCPAPTSSPAVINSRTFCNKTHTIFHLCKLIDQGLTSH